MSNKWKKKSQNHLKYFKEHWGKKKCFKAINAHSPLFGCNTSTSLVNYIMPSVMHFFDVISDFYCK